MLHKRTNGRQSWDDFCKYMQKKYTPANQSQIIRTKIQKQFQLTTVKDYYVEFSKLVVQAYGMNEEEKLSHFINGLRQEIQTHVKLQQPKTIEVAYDLAVLGETYISNKTNKNKTIGTKKVEGLTACLPNDYSYSVKSLTISESNTYECNEENIEVHSDFRPGCGEPLRTSTYLL